MTYARKVDANQSVIVGYLRDRGASVTLLHRVGQGCPDLLVGWQGRNLLLECKVPKSKGTAAGKDRPEQVAWRATWKGQAFTVRTPFDCERVLRGEPPLIPTDSHRRKVAALEPKGKA